MIYIDESKDIVFNQPKCFGNKKQNTIEEGYTNRVCMTCRVFVDCCKYILDGKGYITYNKCGKKVCKEFNDYQIKNIKEDEIERELLKNSLNLEE